MEDTVFKTIMQQMKHYLRDRQHESLYTTAKESKLRIDVIKKLEEDEIKGSAASLVQYLDSFVARFPIEGKRILYGAVLETAQLPMFPEQ